MIPSDKLLGYAMDGYPIYGPVEDDSVLDECGGVGDSVNYRYHVRLVNQIDNTLKYCDLSGSEAIQWVSCLVRDS